MIKAVGIYKHIHNFGHFEQFMVNDLIPKMLVFPGLIKMDFTKIYQSTDDQPDNCEEVQLFIETYFESMEALKEILSQKEYLDLYSQMIEVSGGESEGGMFMAEEKTFYSPKWLPARDTGENIVEVVYERE